MELTQKLSEIYEHSGYIGKYDHGKQFWGQVMAAFRNPVAETVVEMSLPMSGGRENVGVQFCTSLIVMEIFENR